MANMDENSRLKLNQMIRENSVTDQTELIRELKHSAIIRKEVNLLLRIMEEVPEEATFADLRDLSMVDCNFIFSYYTDIYNRILKRELDISLLNKFLDILEKIEKGECDQHEASFNVGTILKEIYIDSALKKAEKLEKENEEREQAKKSERSPAVKPMNLSWRSYKIQTNKFISEMDKTEISEMDMVD
jgi:hypothetical protein